MREILKRVFWKLPLSYSSKSRIAEVRHAWMLKNEDHAQVNAHDIEITNNQDQLRDYVKYIVGSCRSKASSYKEFEKKCAPNTDVQLIAYYLTQYHPNKDNDEWWGKGTTEWNNVNQAIPQFVGHYQPRRPGELGYYDLRIIDNFIRQIELAKNYGISAFCFYYYWFDGGRRLLEQPLDMFLNNKELDIPFFYCWANESWTKQYSGSDSGILLGLSSSEDTYRRFIDAVIPDFADARYYRINGRPVLSVYRPSRIPNPDAVVSYWKERVRLRCDVEPYLIAVQEMDTGVDWAAVGFDAETEFQPKQILHKCRLLNSEITPIRTDFSGQIYDYRDLVKMKRYQIKDNTRKKVYPAVMPMWDNTARRNQRGIIFHNSSPDLYEDWLLNQIKAVQSRSDLDRRMVFINAWNEWGEGAYLEPDDYYGYAYLNATHGALQKASINYNGSKSEY